MAKEMNKWPCDDCGKIFTAKGMNARYCPKCRKKRLSHAARKRKLNEIGSEAYSQQATERRANHGR